MVGDQLDRDIVPAREAGLLAVWVPSAFRPKWHDSDLSFGASFIADGFLNAVAWLLLKQSEELPARRRAR